MANQRYTLTSYDPIYVVAEEVRIPEEAVRKTALRWLELNVCKDGETPKLNDQWIAKHVEDLNTVEELLIFIRYNMYKDNVEVQQLADQNVICRELATRLVEDLPEDLVEEALYASAYRLEEMLRMNGLQKKDYCEQRGISEEATRCRGAGEHHRKPQGGLGARRLGRPCELHSRGRGFLRDHPGRFGPGQGVQASPDRARGQNAPDGGIRAQGKGPA